MTRLFWDFVGPRAEGTARHFERHLREFFVRERLDLAASGVDEVAKYKWFAYCDVDEAVVAAVTKALRPQRQAPSSPAASSPTDSE
ncbi:MAG: hypothetical protein AAF715_26410 [Myxococcota bacterium]